MNKSSNRHFSMLRAFSPADFFTLANASSGAAAIFLAIRYASGGSVGLIWIALALLPLSLVCDFLDGYIARKTNLSSPLGADLDSLADILSFGMAPAVLGYVLGLNGLWDTIILIYFVACGVARLARYNVTAEELSDESGKVAYYEGTPIPTSVLIPCVLALFVALGRVGSDVPLGEFSPLGWVLHPFSFIYFLSGTAMISATLKIPKP